MCQHIIIKVDENSIWTITNKKIILITPIQKIISKPHYSILHLLLHGRNQFTEHQFRQRTYFFCHYAIKSPRKMQKTNQISVKENKNIDFSNTIRFQEKQKQRP